MPTPERSRTRRAVRRPCSASSRLLAILLSVPLGALPAADAWAQAEGGSEMNAAAAREEYEAAFAAALEMPADEKPLNVVMTWSGVFESAVIAEHLRQIEAGSEAAHDYRQVIDAVVARLRSLRPDSPLPDLLLLLQVQEVETRSEGLLALLDRHPDDPTVLEMTIQSLRQAGAEDRAAAVTEAFLDRQPASTTGYEILARLARDNATRQAEVLQRWARAAPGDPHLVEWWVEADLPRRDPETTAQLFAQLFDRRPQGHVGLQACEAVLRLGDPRYRDGARACVARLAADPDQPELVARSASTALVRMAAADGDWSGVASSLAEMDGESRYAALMAAAYTIETPSNCGQLVALLGQALADAPESGYGGLAASVLQCEKRPEAQALFLELLRRAPAEQVPEMLERWGQRVSGGYVGEIPGRTVEVLEARLAAEPTADGLFRALDIAYQVEGLDERRYGLLRRWYASDPGSMRQEQLLALAGELAVRDRGDDAVALLEKRLETGFRRPLAEAAWGVYLDHDGAEAADRFAARLAAADRSDKATTGQLLLARGALLRGDPVAAERHYWKAQPAERLDKELAVELLTAVGLQGDDAALEQAARRLCEENAAADEDPRCAADLLTRVQRPDLAAGALAELTGDETAEELGRIAGMARSAGRSDLQERALRRLIEIDPLSESGWTGLGLLLESQGRVDDLVALLARSRESFSPPPTTLARCTARALVGADPQRAIEVLQEARDALPEKDDWSRSWIDHELSGAYRRLAETQVTAASHTRIVTTPSLRRAPAPPPEGASAAELRRTADALYSGTGGLYAPDAAIPLLLRAVELGDPLSAFRLALLADGVDVETWPGAPTPHRLYVDSRAAVERLAADGDAFAQYLLGTAALTGFGGDRDLAAARRWLEAAAEQGVGMAWHNLGWMAQTGTGSEQADPEAAVAAYRRGIAAGVTRSARALAELTLTPDAAAEVCREGLEALEGAVETGDAAVAAQLGKLRLYGRGDCVPRDLAAAVGWLEPAAAAGARGASYDLAVALLLRDGRAASGRAVELLERSAALPNALAMELLAFLHATGSVVPRDPEAADRWLADAARVGSDGLPNLRREAWTVDAMQPLVREGISALRSASAAGDAAASGFLAWLGGLGLVADLEPEQRVALARRAAAAGDARAMRVLSNVYLRGAGVTADAAEALRWQRRGAEAGDSFCMMFLGQALLDGERLPRDPAAGVAWLRRSAEAGNWWAVGELGDLYASGLPGLQRDLDEAAVWKRRLAELGDAEATGWLRFHGYSTTNPNP